MTINVDFEEGDRQMTLLALAELALSRPGWNDALERIAFLLRGEKIFRRFKEVNADRVKAERGPLGG